MNLQIRYNYYDIHCDRCGRFVKYSEVQQDGGGSMCFVPDSDVSYEELRHRCKKCTELHGPPYAMQSVNHQICTIIFK